MRVHKCTHLGERKYTYTGEVQDRDDRRIVIKAHWTLDELALNFVRFSPGDVFTETFYFDRWYNIFEIQDRSGGLKGWYGNVTHPVRIIEHDVEHDVEWDDLALDVWMDADGVQVVLDVEEFETLRTQLSSLEVAAAHSGLDQMQAELRRRWRAYANERIAAALTDRGWTLGTAESCTGGLIGDVITDRPGSSAYFLGGVLSYSNDAKRRLLGVSEATLREHGAVSAQCALEMARGARAALGASVGISATGIAGPTGGSESKPIGLTFVGVSSPLGEQVTRNVWSFDRVGNKQATADEALRLIMHHLHAHNRSHERQL